MSFYNGYDYTSSSIPSNAERLNLLEGVLKKYFAQQNITTDSDNEEIGKIIWQKNSQDPSTITGNTAPVMVAWQDQIWVKPVTGVAYPITIASTSTFLTTINSITPDAQGNIDLKSSSSELVITGGTNDITLDISGILAKIATNASGISTNAADIATNTSSITTNASGISTNAAGIAGNTSSIATNASGISTNTSNIAANTSQVATNKTDIATNKADIASLDSSVVKTVGGVSPTSAGDVDISSPNSSISVGSSGNAVTLDIDAGATSSAVISSQANNALVASSQDNKLFVPQQSASGVNSVNSLTGALDIIGGSNITVTQPDSTTISISSAGGGGTSEDFAYSDAVYIGNTAATNPDGSYELPYLNTKLQDAVDGLDASAGKIRLVGKNSEYPMQLSDATGKMTIDKSNKGIFLRDSTFTGSVVVDFSAVTTVPTFSKTKVEFKRVTAGTATVLEFAPYNSASPIDVTIRLTADVINANNSVSLFKLLPNTITTGVKTVTIIITCNELNVTAPVGSNTTAMFDFDRQNITGIDAILVDFRAKRLNFGSMPTQPVKVVLNKGASDRVRFELENFTRAEVSQRLNLIELDYLECADTVLTKNIYAVQALAPPIFLNASDLPTTLNTDGELAFVKITDTMYIFKNGAWVPFQSGSPAVSEDDVVYYDETYSGITADGTINAPFKTAQEAIDSAMTKAAVPTNTDIIEIKPRASAKRQLTESLLFAKASGKNSVFFNAPDITYKGILTIDTAFAGDFPTTIHFLRLNDAQIKYINTSLADEVQATVVKAVEKKIADFGLHSVLVDASGLTDGAKFGTIKHSEQIDNVFEDLEDGFDPTAAVPSMFVDSKDTIDLNVTFNSDIKIVDGIDRRTAPTPAPAVPKFYFDYDVTGTGTSSTFITFLLSGLLDRKGIVYDFVNTRTDTFLKSDIFTAQISTIDTAEIETLTADSTTSIAVTARDVLNLPHATVPNTAYNIGVDPSTDAPFFVDSQNNRRFFSVRSTADEKPSTWFGGDIASDSDYSRVDFPEFHIVDDRNNTPFYMPACSVTTQLLAVPALGLTLSKPLDEHDQATDGNFLTFAYLKLNGSNLSIAVSDASTADENLVSVVFTVASAEEATYLANLKVGNIITLTQDGNNLLELSVALTEVSSASNVLTLKGVPNFGCGVQTPTAEFSIPQNLASIGTYVNLYLGCRGAFNGLVKHLKTANRSFLKVSYFPIPFKHKTLKSLYSIMLFPFCNSLLAESRFGFREIDATRDIPPIFLDILAQKWGAKVSDILYMPISIPIEVNATTNTGISVDNPNAQRRLRAFRCTMVGNHYEMSYIFSPDAEDTALSVFVDKDIYSQSTYSVTSSGSKVLLESENYMGSIVGDIPSVKSIRLKLVVNGWNKDNIIPAFSSAISTDAGGTVLVIDAYGRGTNFQNRFLKTMCLDASADEKAIAARIFDGEVGNGFLVTQLCSLEGVIVFTSSMRSSTVKSGAYTPPFSPPLSTLSKQTGTANDKDFTLVV